MAEIVKIGDLGPGRNFTVEGQLYTVLDIAHNKTAMRQMIVKIKCKNLRTGTISDITFNGDDKVALIYLDKKAMAYLYDDGDSIVFMDNDTYDQVSIPKSRLQWELNFLKEGSIATITYYEGEIMGVELPVKVTLRVVATDDAVKGDTINKAMKTLSLKLVIQLKSLCLLKTIQILSLELTQANTTPELNKIQLKPHNVAFFSIWIKTIFIDKKIL